MRAELMCLTDEAVALLADVAESRRVYWINNVCGSYAVNTLTGRRCTKLARALEATGAIRQCEPRVGVGPHSYDFELTEEGRKALFWHRPGLRPITTGSSATGDTP